MKNVGRIALVILAIGLVSCSKESSIDTEKPVIDLSFEDAFPVNCDTIYFGESFELNMLLSDNEALGSFSVSIHNNFDGHSHSTEVSSCEADEKKEPVNPLTFIEDYAIPEGMKAYAVELMVPIASGNGMGNFDEGDYHFFINLTDKEGWSAQKGISIKMLHP